MHKNLEKYLVVLCKMPKNRAPQPRTKIKNKKRVIPSFGWLPPERALELCHSLLASAVGENPATALVCSLGSLDPTLKVVAVGGVHHFASGGIESPVSVVLHSMFPSLRGLPSLFFCTYYNIGLGKSQ
jgi:hypothetical protein